MRLTINVVFCLLAFVFLQQTTWALGTKVVNYHNDTSSSGVNSTESALTPANLTVNTFSKRFATAVDGCVYAQPLYLPSITVSGGSAPGEHNLVFVATQHDSLYAIDAQSGLVVWKDSFLTTGMSGATSITTMPVGDTGSSDTPPEIGICSTPVIDSSTNMLYVTAKTKQIVNGNTSAPHYVYTIYKIDVTNGNSTANANIVSQLVIGDTIFNGSSYTFRTNSDPSAAQDPFVYGTGDGYITVNSQNRVYFNAMREMNRPGLLLYNGTVFAAFGSHGDVSPYHGWLIGFDKGTLAINAVMNLTPNGGLGGIWNSGGAPVVDSSGYIYLMTGNGTFDGNNSGGVVTGLNTQNMPVNADYGDSIVKIAVDGTTSPSNQNPNGWGLTVVDYFSPFNNQSLSSNDSDLGSGGCVILPDSAGSSAHPHLLIGAGKQGNIYLVDRDAMGEYGNSDNVVQSQVAIGASFDTPAFFNGTLYYGAASDNGKSFSISNASMSTSPTTTPDGFGWPGSTPSISANGTANAIVWMLDRSSNQLRAYAATNLATEIWTSAMASANRDQLGSVEKFTVPVVADGLVFVGTTNSLLTYGLTPLGVAPTVATSAATGVGALSATLSGTVNPKGFTTTVSFQYGLTTDYGNTSSAQNAGAGTTNATFSIPVSGLSPQTTYHYRAIASNSAATVEGVDKTFTTLAQPQIISSPSSPVVYPGATGTEVGVQVDPNGVSTSVYFNYGTNSSYGTSTTAQSAGSGKTPVTIYEIFSNLAPNTTYHFQTVTTGPAGTFYGPDQTFTTLAFDSTLVMQKSDPAPGVSGGTFASFGNPSINANNYIAFKGTLTTGVGGVISANDSGIWADDGTGTLQLIARVGVGTAPGTTATYASLSDPVYNDNNYVAFRGVLKVGAGEATYAMSTGVWCNSSGALSLIAQQGSTQAPGCPTGVTFSNFLQIALANQGGANNQGRVIMLATLNSGPTVKTSSDLGIWAVDSTGALQLVVRTGDVINGKTVTGLSFLPAMSFVGGQSRSFSQANGNLVYIATFSDGSSAIMTVSF